MNKIKIFISIVLVLTISLDTMIINAANEASVVNSIISIDSKNELSTYINNIKLKKETLSDIEYSRLLDITISKITILENKYKENTKVLQNLNELKIKINELKSLNKENKQGALLGEKEIESNNLELENIAYLYSLNDIVKIVGESTKSSYIEAQNTSLPAKSYTGTGEIKTDGNVVKITYKDGDIEELPLENGVFYFKNGKNFWATGPWKGQEVDYGRNSPSNSEMKELFGEDFTKTFYRSLADDVELDWNKIKKSKDPEQEVSNQLSSSIKGKYDPILRKTGDKDNANLSIIAENGKILDNVGSITGIKGEGLRVSIDEDKMSLYGYSDKEIKEYKKLLYDQVENLTSFGKLTQTEIKTKALPITNEEEVFGSDGFNKYGINKYGVSKYVSYNFSTAHYIGNEYKGNYEDAIDRSLGLKNLEDDISNSITKANGYIKKSGYDPDQFDEKQKLLLSQYMISRDISGVGWHIPTTAELEWVKGVDIKPTTIVYTGKKAFDMSNFEKKDGKVELVKIEGAKVNDLTKTETEKKYKYDIPEYRYINGQLNPEFLNLDDQISNGRTGNLKSWNKVYNEIYGTDMPKSLADNLYKYSDMVIPPGLDYGKYASETDLIEIKNYESEIKKLLESGKVKEANFEISDNMSLNSRETEINKLYQDLLGRNADIDGLKNWTNSNLGITQIQNFIKNSIEYKTAQENKINSLDPIEKVYEKKGYDIITKGDNVATTDYIIKELPKLAKSTENAVNLAIEYLKNDLDKHGIKYSESTDLKKLEKGDIQIAQGILEREGYRVDTTSDYGYGGIRGFDDLNKVGFRYQEMVIITEKSEMVKNTTNLSSREREINSLFSSMLGRNADVNTLKTLVNSTYEIKQIDTFIKKSDEYKVKHPEVSKNSSSSSSSSSGGGSTTTRTQEIENLYQTVLGRTSDNEGLKARSDSKFTIDEIKDYMNSHDTGGSTSSHDTGGSTSSHDTGGSTSSHDTGGSTSNPVIEQLRGLYKEAVDHHEAQEKSAQQEQIDPNLSEGTQYIPGYTPPSDDYERG